MDQKSCVASEARHHFPMQLALFLQRLKVPRLNARLGFVLSPIFLDFLSSINSVYGMCLKSEIHKNDFIEIKKEIFQKTKKKRSELKTLYAKYECLCKHVFNQ